VGEVWGVGRRLSEQLAGMGITTVRALRDADAALIRREFSVVLERTVYELRGVSCLALEEVAPNKQQIMASRSFGEYVYALTDLEEAVSTYIARAAEKLRRQHSLANAVQVYIRTNPFSEKQTQYQRGITVPLTQATSDTMRLTRAVLWGLKRIYRPGFAYQKAGVMLMDLHGEDQAQGVLFAVSAPARPMLMDVIDRANARWGRGTLKLAAEGVRKPWQMKRERVSPAYTTRWDELPRVN
jgi:DNA polymerase V